MMTRNPKGTLTTARWTAGATLGLAALLAGFAAPMPARADVAEAQAAMQICASNFPNARKTLRAFNSAKWAKTGKRGDIDMVLSPGGKTMAGAAGSSKSTVSCMISSDGLSSKEAIAIVSGLAAGPATLNKLKSPMTSVPGVWSGTLNGKKIMVFVSQPTQIGNNTGAVIMLDAPK